MDFARGVGREEFIKGDILTEVEALKINTDKDENRRLKKALDSFIDITKALLRKSL